MTEVLDQPAERLKTRFGLTLKSMGPPPTLSVTEWSDRYRILSPESSSEPGPWRTRRVPWTRFIMDAYKDPLVTRVVIKSSAQVAKTECINNMIGYGISENPGPMLAIYPTVDLAQAWSKERLAPMLRDTPRLQGLVAEARSRDSATTLLHKQFPGGHLSMVGANSPAGLSMRPIRDLFADEVDRFPHSAGKEGDPIDLGRRRLQTFHDAKEVMTSTPTDAEVSRIEALYLESDQRHFVVPCRKCGRFQPLRWAQVKIPNEGGKYFTDDTYYQCAHCETKWNDAQVRAAVQDLNCVAQAEFKGKAGFYINQLYSPWSTLRQIAAEFRVATESRSRDRLKTWVNTVLGEVWRDKGQGVKLNSLMDRREQYTPEALPDGVLVITAAVDVQDSRLEVEVKGWGEFEESWGIEKVVIPGDPELPQVWLELNRVVHRTYTTKRGLKLRIKGVFADSGAHTQRVYRWVRDQSTKSLRNTFAIKGVGGWGRAILGKPSIVRPTNAILIPLGVDEAKSNVYAHLNLGDPGPGFQHFPIGFGYDQEHFEQLVSEERHTVYRKGIYTFEWRKKKESAANEALDLAVYNYCAILQLKPNWKAFKTWADRKATEMTTDGAAQEKGKGKDKNEEEPEVAPTEAETVTEEEAPAEEPRLPKLKPPAPRPQNHLRRGNGGYVNSWKRGR